MTYFINDMIKKRKCFKCRDYIDIEHSVYYVFIGKTSTENAEYCVKCYLQDVQEKTKLDPFLSPLYSKNFIRMNK